MARGRRIASPSRALVAVLALAACDFERPSVVAASSSRAARPAADGQGASCEQHGVLQALCTKCNPRLAPVFQQKGDWCEEHGLPESICPVCHPERGGRPAVDVQATASDEAPADGTKVTLARPDVEVLAGIRTTKVVARTGGPVIEAVARVVYDAARVGKVGARADSVVKELLVDVGSQVKKGQALAVLESAAVGEDRARLSSARARLSAAEQAHAREVELFEKGISAAKDVQAALQEREAARAEVAAAEAALGVVGASAAGRGGYAVPSPIEGVVVRREVSVGQAVSAGAILFEVVDPRAMQAELEVREADLPRARAGQKVELALDALPGRSIEGTLTFLAPEIDPRTRTARARVALKDDEGLLRANASGRARIEVSEERSALVIPRAALQSAKGQPLVFVKTADGRFEARRVVLGLEADGLVEIAEGLKEGEEVVTTGSFLLKTETLKDSIGAGCCD